MKAQAIIEQVLREDVYKLSSTQVNLPAALADFVIKWGREMIPDKDLYYDEKGNLGRETEGHITVLYGLTDAKPSSELLKLVRETAPFTVRLTGVTFFDTNPDYDVVKFDAESEELVSLSNAIRQACPNENKFPDYHAHCTIAYVKKGRVPDLAGNYPFEQNPPIPPEFEVNEVLFKPAGDSGDPERKVVHIPLNRYRKECSGRCTGCGCESDSLDHFGPGKDVVRKAAEGQLSNLGFIRVSTDPSCVQTWERKRGQTKIVAWHYERKGKLRWGLGGFWHEKNSTLYHQAWEMDWFPGTQALKDLVMEAEDPKDVFRRAKQAAGLWIVRRDNDANGSPLPKPNYLKIDLPRFAVWQLERDEATRFRSEEEARQVYEKLYRRSLRFTALIIGLSFEHVPVTEAEDSNAALKRFYRGRGWLPEEQLESIQEGLDDDDEDAAVATLKKHYGLGEPDYDLEKAEKEADAQGRMQAIAKTTARAYLARHKWNKPLGEVRQRGPFDMLKFPTDAAVLAAKLLELDHGEKPAVL